MLVRTWDKWTTPCPRAERTDVAHPRAGRTDETVMALRRASHVTAQPPGPGHHPRRTAHVRPLLPRPISAGGNRVRSMTWYARDLLIRFTESEPWLVLVRISRKHPKSSSRYRHPLSWTPPRPNNCLSTSRQRGTTVIKYIHVYDSRPHKYTH